MKKLLLILLVVLLSFSFSSCSQSEIEETNSTPEGAADVKDDEDETEEIQTEDEINILTYAYYVDPVLQLDPSNTIANEIHILNSMYENLLYYDPYTGEYDYVLAEDYEKSDDNLSWTFYIREGVKFHDGTELTAEDVKFSIDRTIEKNQGQAYIWDNVEEIVVVDDYTVRFDLVAPCPMEAIVSTAKGAHIYSKDAVESGGEEFFSEGNDAGTGPYTIESITWGTETVLKRFDDYWRGWDDNKNPYDYVVTKLVSEPSNRRQMVEMGEANIAIYLTKEDLEALEENPSVDLAIEKSVKTAYIALSIEKPALSNLNVRKALSYAFPYQKAIEFSTLSGLQAHGPIAPGILGYSEDVFQYTHDLEQAERLLSEAGYAPGELSLNMTYQSGDETLRTMAELYQEELNKIGVELELLPMTWSQMASMITAEDPMDRQDMFLNYSMPAVLNGQTSLRYYISGGASNYARYDNPEVTQLIADAYEMSGVDQEEAEDMFVDAANIVIEDAVSIWVATINDVYALNGVSGFVPNPAYTCCLNLWEMYSE